MGWRIFATAEIRDSHATLYLTPQQTVCLRAKAGEALLLDRAYATVEDAIMDAAVQPQLPQPLYDALLDAVERRSHAEAEELRWTPQWPDDS
ncbi:hypothetical protein [Deinococcus sonorensis]|uniref:DUF5753 domain-containing protein n=2 Tax=Deinococcus sonorensis TaxID=309891 RepID=A0AAU7UBA6_9DEIO